MAAQIHDTQSLSVYALARGLQRQYALLEGRRSLFAMDNAQHRACAWPAAVRSRPAVDAASGDRGRRQGRGRAVPGSAIVQLWAQATERKPAGAQRQRGAEGTAAFVRQFFERVQQGRRRQPGAGRDQAGVCGAPAVRPSEVLGSVRARGGGVRSAEVRMEVVGDRRAGDPGSVTPSGGSRSARAVKFRKPSRTIAPH